MPQRFKPLIGTVHGGKLLRSGMFQYVINR